MGGFFPSQWLQAPVLDAVQRLKVVAEDAGLTLARLALAWVLREPTVAAAIVGATGPEQIREHVADSGKSLDAKCLQHVDEILGPVLTWAPQRCPSRHLSHAGCRWGFPASLTCAPWHCCQGVLPMSPQAFGSLPSPVRSGPPLRFRWIYSPSASFSSTPSRDTRRRISFA